jgi:hypothetical protein
MPPRGLPPERMVRWAKTYRCIPSRYPPIDLFERISDPSDWEILAAVEGLTNDRLREEIGNVALVPVAERLSGPGASPIMAAFTHVGFPSRFTRGTYGVYYASDRIEGALREGAHHRGVFLGRTSEPKTLVQMRTYVGRIAGKLRDVRGGWPEIHDPDSHTRAQELGERVRALGGNGIVFDGVRLPIASNVAVFRPRVLRAPAGKPHVIQGPHLTMEWDGARISRYILMGDPEWTPLPSLTD